MPRLKAAWTHGVLVILDQISCTRTSVVGDGCRVCIWPKGAPPAEVVARAKPHAKTQATTQDKPKAQPKAQAAPAAVSQQVLVEQKFKTVMAAMKSQEGRVVVRGDWVLLKELLRLLKLPSNQTTRDYLTGGTCWRLGPGRGVCLAEGTDWKHISGESGGGRGKGHPHVKSGVLEDVSGKYFRHRRVHV